MCGFTLHTMNFGSEMIQAKHISGKNIFCSMNEEKIREERIFEILHCPLEGRAKVRHSCQPNGPVGWCQLGGNLKGNVQFQKFFFPCFCIHSQSKIYFFQRHVLPTPFLSKNSLCGLAKRLLRLVFHTLFSMAVDCFDHDFVAWDLNNPFCFIKLMPLFLYVA